MEPRAARLVVVVVAAVVAVCAVLVAVSVMTRSSEAAGAGATSSDPDAPVVAFYGDSYTLGTGASDPAKRWSSVISAERGWNEFNYSVNGLGFVNNRQSTPPDYAPDDGVSRSIAIDPDILFVTMGLNDNFSMPERSDEVRAAIRTDLATLRGELPGARIVVVEPFWYTDDRPESVEQIIAWVRSEAAAIDADYLPGASHWIEGHPEWMASDGLHPNDDGYAEMAVRMDESLDAIGL